MLITTGVASERPTEQRKSRQVSQPNVKSQEGGGLNISYGTFHKVNSQLILTELVTVISTQPWWGQNVPH